MIELQLLGGLDVSSPDLSATSRVRRRHPLALLALVAASPQGISRDRIMGFLWPESDADRASNSLRQTLFLLRNDLGDDVFLPEMASGIQINPAVVTMDLRAFREAVQGGKAAEAVELYSGPFVDGFQLPGATEFSQWVDTERDKLTREYAAVLDGLAQKADADGLYDDAVAWRRRQAAVDPFSSRVALALLRALAGAGDRTGALEYAAVYENLVRHHLEVDPDPAVSDFVATLRTAPPSAFAVQPRPETTVVVRPAPATATIPASATDVGTIHGSHPRPIRRAWLVAAGVVLVLGAVAANSALRGGPPAEDDGVLILGSGIAPVAGRDTANMMVSCEGKVCPEEPLPQPAFVVPGHPSYAAAATGTSYIAHVADATTKPPPGYDCCTTVAFERAFQLPLNAVWGTISISMLADNQGIVYVNGVEIGRHTDKDAGWNYGGAPAVFSATFTPDPSGVNHLRISLWAGGGADGLNYRAIVTYQMPEDTSTTPETKITRR